MGVHRNNHAGFKERRHYDRFPHRLHRRWSLRSRLQDPHRPHRAREACHPDPGCQPQDHQRRGRPLHRHWQLLHPYPIRARHQSLLAWKRNQHYPLFSPPKPSTLLSRTPSRPCSLSTTTRLSSGSSSESSSPQVDLLEQPPSALCTPWITPVPVLHPTSEPESVSSTVLLTA